MFIELVILAFCLLFYSHYNKRKHLPPGPISVPFIGSLFGGGTGGGTGGFKLNREEFYKYGDMCSIFLGPSTMIIINDLKRAKDLFNRDEFSGKSTLSSSQYVFFSNDSIVQCSYLTSIKYR